MDTGRREVEINMEKNSIFQKESLDYAESPEQLDAYIKSSAPGIWIVLTALIIFMLTAVIWSVTGTLPETLEARGRTDSDGNIFCYIPYDSDSLPSEGCKAGCVLPDGTRMSGRVYSVSSQPLSKAELKESIHSDWIAENLLTEDYSYEVVITADKECDENLLASVAITTDEVKPITFVIN
ncbi:MAG: hypothetical protein HFH14_05985 [Lachnospiraceae bacterium]|nr:hypothetical protein [Lachnospiraceae bacterium]